MASGSGPGEDLPRPALSRCLDISVAAFAAEYWGERPHLSRTSGFDNLFSAAAVDELVARRGLRTPFLRMARNGTVLPATRFTAPGGVGAQIADQADADKIARELADGTTLVLQGLHRTWPAVRSFTDQLVADLGHPVQVNAYVTPPASQGFAAHYDTHDVFVLQIAGTKSWQLHRPVLEHPLPSQPWEQRRTAVAARAAEPPYLDTTLAPGDSLYVPRGWLHSAAANEDVSIHLTVGIHTLSARDVVDAIAQRSADDAALRRNLPLGAGTDPAAFGDVIEALVKEATARMAAVPADDVAAHLARAFDTAIRPEAVAPLAQLAAAADAGVRVRARRGLRLTTVRADGGVTLRGGGRSITAPAACRAALATVARGEAVTAADLPGLDRADAVVLIRRLLAEEIVVPVGS